MILSTRLREVMALDPSVDAMEFERTWWTWGELGAAVDQVASRVEPGAQVGILLRNRPPSIALLLGVLVGGGCVVTINPGRGAERTRDDVAGLDLAAIAGEPDDLDAFVPATYAATRWSLSGLDADLNVTASDAADSTPRRPDVAVRMLTSGTTGPPKRVDLTYRTLEQVLHGAKHYESSQQDAPRLRNGIALVNSPLVHLGGLFRVLMCLNDGRSFCLLPRFEVGAWVDAVRRHRVATSTLVPAALRMVLDADVDPDALASLRSVVSGTAPLDPDDADAFTERFGVPVLVSYAATEFGGGVAGWNLADYREFWVTKRGSVGRAHAGCELRVVDPDTGDEVATDAEGVLEVRARQLDTDDWVRTTDIARIDADGFLFILGRADQAIVRGGFKVSPEEVRATLERHPAVRGAAVIGIPDERLGAVPVAAVELRDGAGDVGETALVEFLAPRLARYEIPTRILVVDELPRTDSGKVDLGTTRSLFDDPRVEI